MADIIIIIILVAVVYFIVRGQLNRRGSGQNCGCSGCTGCSGRSENRCSCDFSESGTDPEENSNGRRQG
ncbi:MAG: FeoB-associated Cys-rich membrane protein [Lachnospiraceae bacterium]|nr:FeoB-associated Cys-rich membrane protein [Lachnospiraceae bacterium]